MRATSLDVSETFPRWSGASEKVASATTGSRGPTRPALLIVGNGMVGHRLCERLVELGGDRRYAITVLAEESTPAYDRVHLTEILKGQAAQALVLREPSWYRDKGIELHLGETALGIDRERRVVTTQNGRVFGYDRLILATGSYAMVPRFECSGATKLLPYRTMHDAESILKAVKGAHAETPHIAIVGAGLLGIEAGRVLMILGCRVTVLEMASQVLPRQLDARAAASLESLLVESGLDIRTKVRIARIDGSETNQDIEFSDGSRLMVDAIVVAAGARARDGIAREAGLRCHPRGGVEVDTGLRTSDPDIYAIGECATHRHVPHGLVAPGYAMANVLAERLSGKRRRLEAQHAVTRLKLDLTEVNVIGNPLADGAGLDLVWERPDGYRHLVAKGKRVVAAVSIGPWAELPEVERAIRERRRFSNRTLNAFVDTGTLELRSGGDSIATWPDRAVVCQCAGVTCGTLRLALRSGESTPEGLARRTCAGTLCGSCRPLLGQLCGGPATNPTQPDRLTPRLGVAALVVALVALAVPRIPIAESIRDWGFTRLWVDPYPKRVTGFLMLGLVVLGLGLSANKRLPHFKVGSYAGWRLVHAAVGLTTVLLLAVHTGLRLGNNLNFALSVGFVVATVTGAYTALQVLLAGPPDKSRFRMPINRLARSVHDYAVFPLSVLLIFHLLKVFYY
jgi:nitrite reductase (NADH) large subunit